MSTLELLDRAAGATMCDVLDIAGSTMLNMGIWSAATGVGAKPGLALMGLGTASLLANNYLCEPMDVGNAQVPGIDGCRKVDGHGVAQIYDGVGRWINPWNMNTDEYREWSYHATEITANFVQKADEGWHKITRWKTLYGDLEYWAFYNATEEAPPPSTVRILVSDWRPMVQRGHRLLALARRLPSSVRLQQLTEHPDWKGETLLIRDRSGLLWQPGESDKSGFWQPDSAAEVRPYLDRFEELWRHSATHVEFRSTPL